MSRLTLEHPPAERLAAFRVGDLSPEEMTQLEAHVADCGSCCARLKSLPDDSLLALLRRSFDTPTAEAVPPELADHPRYRLRELLGAGGMGAVYKAEHLLLERPVALKVISRSLTDRPAAVERFRREARLAARLSHPNIVAAHDAEQAGDSHFLVMEFVAGVNLAQLVRERGPLPVDRACDYAAQAACGLQHAFEHGMVHRDIKPHNLMLTPDGRVKVLDFGLARFASEVGVDAVPPAAGGSGSEAGATSAGLVLGTADYIAPEQADDPRTADIRSDLYSLGCTLHFLLTGRVPFPAASVLDKLAAHREQEPPPLTDVRQDVPAGLGVVLGRLMAKDPACRYQTPAEAAEALAAFATPPGPAPAPVRRGRRTAVLCAAVCATLLAGVIVFVRTDRGELIIEAEDDSVAVLVEKAGVKVRDRSTGREYLLQVGQQDLRSGEYEIEVKEAGGLEFSVKRFTLKRGNRVRVSARVRRGVSPQAEKAELERLQGRWKPIQGEYNGVKVPAQMFALVPSVVATGNTIQLTRTDGVEVVLTVRLDPTTTPHRVDGTARIRSGKEPMAEVAGIYRLEGDTLTLCASESKEDRPTEFVTRPRSGHRLLVFRRLK